MDEKQFCQWLASQFDFDCYANDLFHRVLTDTIKEINLSTVNGVPFPEHYPPDELRHITLQLYVGHLEMLLKLIPSSPSPASWHIHGIDLNTYASRKDELLSLIRKLETRS